MSSPLFAVQYRLEGAGSNHVWAREMMLTAAERNVKGLETRPLPKTCERQLTCYLAVGCILTGFMSWLMYYYLDIL